MALAAFDDCDEVDGDSDGDDDGGHRLQGPTVSDEIARCVETADRNRAFTFALIGDHELPLLEDLFHRPEWMARGACVGQPIELFFPLRGERTEPAKEICARCPVRAECLEYALGVTDPTGLLGIWGGTSQRRRRQLRTGAA